KSNTEILPNFTLYCTTYLLLMVRRSLGSTLFPYTTLFRSILLRIDKLVDRLVYLLSGWSEYKYEFQTNNHERNQQQGVFEPAQHSHFGMRFSIVLKHDPIHATEKRSLTSDDAYNIWFQRLVISLRVVSERFSDFPSARVHCLKRGTGAVEHCHDGFAIVARKTQAIVAIEQA